MLGRIATVAALAVGGIMLSKKMKSRDEQGMSSVQEIIDVDVPLSTAYNQWTQFEDFPMFMNAVQEVRQVDDTHLHWKATIAGKLKEWDTEITQQIPDRRIAWRSTSGAQNSGSVNFERLGADRTRIVLRIRYLPEDFLESAADAVGVVKLQTKQNLSKFKDFLETRGTETGAWRGSVGAGGAVSATH